MIDTNNIVLIGMPGSGKSTCGVLCAKALCKKFIDTDLLIQEAEGAPLWSIINEKGIEYFNKAEDSTLTSLEISNTVVATGGSAVYSRIGMARLRAQATIVYLEISYEEMLRRIKNIRTRGIVLSPNETLKEMYSRRVALYEKYADSIVETDYKTVEETVNEICKPIIEGM